MSSVSSADIPLESPRPAQHLRRVAAAVRVHFTWWGVHKTLTAPQKEEVSDACGADARLLSAGKKIVDVRHPAFRRLTAIRTRTVSYWRGLTLPYVEAGLRLIRRADIESFVHTLEGFCRELRDAEADLSAVYDEIKVDARQRLGRLYNPADYPAEIRGLFSVDWDFPSVEPPNYLLQIAPEVYQQEQARVARRFEEAVRLAEEAFVAEFSKVVSHLTERLSGGRDGQPKIFRDSAVANLREFFERFRLLNVRSNPELDALVTHAEEAVRGIAPQELRDQEGLRRQVAAQLTAVQASLDGFLVNRPRRRIIRPSLTDTGASHAAAH